MCIYLWVFPDCLKMLNCKIARHTKLIMNYTIGYRLFFLLQPCAITTTWFMLELHHVTVHRFPSILFHFNVECSQFFFSFLLFNFVHLNNWKFDVQYMETVLICSRSLCRICVMSSHFVCVSRPSLLYISFCSVDLKPLGRRILWHTFFCSLLCIKASVKVNLHLVRICCVVGGVFHILPPTVSAYTTE